MYFLVYILTNNLTHYKQPPSPGKLLPTLKETGQIALTFLLATTMRIFFRSPDITEAKEFFLKICSASLFTAPVPLVVKQFWWCLPMLTIEWLQREKVYILEMRKFNPVIRILVYSIIITAIYLFCRKQSATECYYFKF
jgi:hypothetical protein